MGQQEPEFSAVKAHAGRRDDEPFLGEVKFIREGTIINAILIGQYIRLYFFIYRRIKASRAVVAETVPVSTN